MRDVISLAQKGFHVIKSLYVVVITISLVSCSALRTDPVEIVEISDEGYQLLNDFYSGNKSPLYYKTVEEPSWEQLMVFDSIFERVTYPVRMSNEELKELLSETDLLQIRSQIKQSRPVKIDPGRLMNIGTTRHKKKGFMISRPIVLDHVAILRQVGEKYMPVYIFTKNADNKWEVRYTFYQQLILE